MREIEALIEAEVQVFAGHEDHWELIEEEGAAAIANRQLAEEVSAHLRFVTKAPGMLQLFGKKPNARDHGSYHIQASFDLEATDQRPYFVRWNIQRRTE